MFSIETGNGLGLLCTFFPVHYPTRDLRSRLGLLEKARLVKAGSHYLYYQLNDLNAAKIPAEW